MSDTGTSGVERPDPPEDPFACSICGEPLGTAKRLDGEEHCDACLREYGFKPPRGGRHV